MAGDWREHPAPIPVELLRQVEHWTDDIEVYTTAEDGQLSELKCWACTRDATYIVSKRVDGETYHAGYGSCPNHIAEVAEHFIDVVKLQNEALRTRR